MWLFESYTANVKNLRPHRFNCTLSAFDLNIQNRSRPFRSLLVLLFSHCDPTEGASNTQNDGIKSRSSVALYVTLLGLLAACKLSACASQREPFLRAVNCELHAACSGLEQAQLEVSPAHLYLYGTLGSQLTRIHGHGHRNVVFVGALVRGCLRCLGLTNSARHCPKSNGCWQRLSFKAASGCAVTLLLCSGLA